MGWDFFLSFFFFFFFFLLLSVALGNWERVGVEGAAGHGVPLALHGQDFAGRWERKVWGARLWGAAGTLCGKKGRNPKLKEEKSSVGGKSLAQPR